MQRRSSEEIGALPMADRFKILVRYECNMERIQRLEDLKVCARIVWAQIEARSRRRGVIRSSLQPEETAGLTRSGDLSRMLPFEAHLMAAGWPRNAGPGGACPPQFPLLHLFPSMLPPPTLLCIPGSLATIR